MSGQVDFIVAPDADADAILRDHNAIERWGGATWKWLDHTKLYALHGLLAGRFPDYVQFCKESTGGSMSPENDKLLGELLKDFEPGQHFDGAFLHHLPSDFVHSLARLEKNRIPEVAAQWHESPDMQSWPREWVVDALGDLKRLANQATGEQRVFFMRVSNLY